MTPGCRAAVAVAMQLGFDVDEPVPRRCGSARSVILPGGLLNSSMTACSGVGEPIARTATSVGDTAASRAATSALVLSPLSA